VRVPAITSISYPVSASYGSLLRIGTLSRPPQPYSSPRPRNSAATTSARSYAKRCIERRLLIKADLEAPQRGRKDGKSGRSKSKSEIASSDSRLIPVRGFASLAASPSQHGTPFRVGVVDSCLPLLHPSLDVAAVVEQPSARHTTRLATYTIPVN